MQASTNIQFHPPKPHHHHDHNCAVCHAHDHHEHQTHTKSLIKKIHEHNGHQCTDHDCNIKEPHAHVHNHHETQSNTLEALIAASKLPHSLKEFLMNSSFMLPALFGSNLVEKLPIPKIFKTWLAITGMHLVNRGNTKLGRLGLTYLVSGAASLDKSLMHKQEGAYTFNITRFLATSLIALIEKFAGDAHHKQGSEIKTIFSNLTDTKKWTKFIPSLVNIEAKVQIIAPLISYTLSKLQISSNKFIKTLLQGLSISLGFVISDTFVKYFAKSLGQDSSFATALSASCACCGSPVCTVAATDSAISNSF